MAQRAIALLDDEDSATVGTAHWALGDGLALLGDNDGASTAFERSITLLERNRRWREAAEAARAWARVLREAGRADEALDVLDRSAEFALRLSPGSVQQLHTVGSRLELFRGVLRLASPFVGGE